MNGNIDLDGDIYQLLIDTYGHEAVLNSKIGTEDDCIYSDGFIRAIESGLIPSLELKDTDSWRFSSEEYHHVIINDECYNVEFKNTQK